MPTAKTKTPLRVLLVDDNDMTRTLLRGILVSEEYQLAGEASNGEQGLELAVRYKPDIVCLDIQMPKADGLDVLKRIKDSLPETVVIMVTGSAERETVQSAIAGGADGYVVKPFNSARVLDTVAAAVAKRKKAGQAG